MNFIAEKIEQLLLKNSCVIIPSFGGFIKHNGSAVIRERDISPPLAEVSFNSLLLHDDGLLCQTIMEEENVAYATASKLLSKHIDELKTDLINSKQLIFGNIGEFTFKDNILIFKPFNAKYLPENFGLENVIIKKQNRTKKIGENIEVKNETVIIKISNFRTKFVRIAAIFIIACFVAMFMPNTSNSNQYAGFLVNNNKFDKKDDYLKSDSELEVFAKIVEKQIETQLKTENKLNTADVSQNAENHYYIVVASFENRNQAEKFCKQNINLCSTISVLMSKNEPVKYRCVLASFSTIEQAISIQTKFKNFKNSWILYQE